MDRTALRELKKSIDFSFKEFSRAYGDAIEGFFDPLLYFLIWLEKLLVSSPWPIVIGVFALLAWIGSRSIKLVIGTVVCFIVIGYFGMWKNCMATVAIISVSTLVCIVNNFSLVEHNCKVINNCHISKSVTLNGDVKINEKILGPVNAPIFKINRR